MATRFYEKNNPLLNPYIRANDIIKHYSNIVIDKEISDAGYRIDLRFSPEKNGKPYTLRIKYKASSRSIRAYIIDPIIYDLTNGKKPPHIYKPFSRYNCQICLYMKNEWNYNVSDTAIVEWAAEWIFYFQGWLITGNWNGGGHGNE